MVKGRGQHYGILELVNCSLPIEYTSKSKLLFCDSMRYRPVLLLTGIISNAYTTVALAPRRQPSLLANAVVGNSAVLIPNLSLSNGSHLALPGATQWPPRHPWPSDGRWPFSFEDSSISDMPRPHTRFKFTMSHPGHRAGHGQTYITLAIVRELFHREAWPELSDSRLQPAFRNLAWSKGLRLGGNGIGFDLNILLATPVQRVDENLSALLRTVIRLLLGYLENRGCMSLDVRVETQQAPRSGTYRHLADFGIQLEPHVPLRLRHPWPQPLSLPLDVPMNTPPSGPAIVFRFRPLGGLAPIIGDAVDTGTQADLLRSVGATYASRPRQISVAPQHFPNTVAKIALNVISVSGKLTAGLVASVLQGLATIIQERGAIHIMVDIIQSTIRQGQISLVLVNI